MYYHDERPSTWYLNNLAKVTENIERLDPTNSKERLETWKYAAEEIVDLLNTIRQEGEGGIVNKKFLVMGSGTWILIILWHLKSYFRIKF